MADERFRLLARPILDAAGAQVYRGNSVQLPFEDCLNPVAEVSGNETALEFNGIELDPFEKNALTPSEMSPQQFAVFWPCA